jgi:hypothetical protein
VYVPQTGAPDADEEKPEDQKKVAPAKSASKSAAPTATTTAQNQRQP